jgi:Xaa-Pro aminopeptidase
MWRERQREARPWAVLTPQVDAHEGRPARDADLEPVAQGEFRRQSATNSQDLGPTTRIGIDPHVISQDAAAPLAKALETDPTRAFLPIKDNLVDDVWGDARPARPSNPVFRLGDEYAGESVSAKLASLRDKLARAGSPGTVVSALDEVAWLFNLRGTDIPYNPVFFAYAIVTPDDCTLYAQQAAIPQEVREYLTASRVAVLDYGQIWPALENWREHLNAQRRDAEEKKKRAAEAAAAEPQPEAPPAPPAPSPAAADPKSADPKEKIVKTDKVIIGKSTSWAIAQALGDANVDVRRSLIEDAKARKNATEIEGFRRCHIRDGAALVRYFAWLDEVLANGEQWTEFDAATQLEKFRSENELFKGLSFDTISSTGANAAVIHYSPAEQGSAVIDRNQVYLCDSGAQYMDGTTDTTRTWHFGTPNAREKRAFTRVLQGHIALDTVVFPAGTSGYVLDTVARRPLWSDGLDYRHGTGHGVGHFLNVHEGPQGVGPRVAYNDIGLVEGMVLSNEPGYYEDGAFGIRIESVVVVRNASTPNNFAGKTFLGFENFTMVSRLYPVGSLTVQCPIQTSFMDHDLLTTAERTWINEYHAEVLAKVTPKLEAFSDERALAWLKNQCQPI